MWELSPDFDYLLRETEQSRLPAKKKMAFAVLLLDADDVQLQRLAASVGQNPDSFEVIALTQLSKGGAQKELSAGTTRMLTYDEGLIREATVNPS